jgi:predicted nucleic acid-binding protein
MGGLGDIRPPAPKASQGSVKGFTLDAGALIAIDRDDRRVLALVERAQERGARITIPATVLAQAIRNPARQIRLTRLIRQPLVDLVELDGPDATAVGMLLARTRTTDIADAHVAICAQRMKQAVVTSDPVDLSKITPDLQLVAI